MAQPAAAWNDAWDRRFTDAGLDPELLMQLRVTGGMGASEAELQQVYDRIVTQSEQQFERIRTAYPDEARKLEQAKVPKAQVAELAEQVLAGSMSENEFATKVDELTSMTSSGVKRMLLGDMLPYGIIPGWGAWMTLGALGKGVSKGDLAKSAYPFSDRRMFGTRMDAAIAPFLAGGGALTLYHLASEQRQLAAGRNAIIRDPGAARIAAQAGVDGRSLSFNPFARQNRVTAGLARYGEIKAGVQHLERVAPGSEQATLARRALTMWEQGRINVISDPVMGGSKKMPLGIFSQVRGMTPFTQRGKALADVRMMQHVPTIVMDTRLHGASTTAHFAAAATKLAEPGVAGRAAAARSETIMARATQDLLRGADGSAARLSQPSSMRLMLGKIRPGAVDDAFKAVTRLERGTVGAPSGVSGLMSKFTKLPAGGKLAAVAGVGSVLVGAGYLAMGALKKSAPQTEAGAPVGPNGAPAQPSSALAAPGAATNAATTSPSNTMMR